MCNIGVNMDYKEIIKKLEIIPVKDLKHHEERIPANIIKLKEAMLNIGQLVDPVIIDNKHNIILDGNHRVKVLQLIKVPNVVCQIVDYEDPEIEIGGWYPTSRRIKKEIFDGTDVKLESVDRKQGEIEVENKKAAFMLVNSEGNYLVSPGDYSLGEMIEEQQSIMKKIGNDFSYLDDDTVEKELKKGKGSLFRKIYTKEEVIKRANEGNPFPPKSTRHLIPDRIIRLNMKLGWLHQDKEESWKYLERLLKNRIYAGNVRRYVEPVIVIY